MPAKSTVISPATASPGLGHGPVHLVYEAGYSGIGKSAPRSG